MISEKKAQTKAKATRAQIKGAKELLRLGFKVLAYRRDLLPDEEVERLERATQELRGSLGQKKSVTSAQLNEKADVLDGVLKKSGGMYYHKKGWVENIEMLLVAAIVVIGIRSFFLQPFIIPTNSMYPSFYGMQPHVYEDGEPVPNLAERMVDKILLGASHYRLEAEKSGHIYLVLQNGGSFNLTGGVFSSREYIFEIGGKEHFLSVPTEFDLDEVLARKFANVDDLRDLPRIIPQEGFNGMKMKLSENPVKKGEIVLALDILLGDALFVDRFTYNFVRPKSGDPAVFRTGMIDAFNHELGAFPGDTYVKPRIGEDKYYIKRLVGEPGDELEMRVPENIYTNGTDLIKGVPGVLFRNGKPIEGKDIFEQNRLRTESLAKDPNAKSLYGYPGYRAEGLMSNKKPLTVPSKDSPGNPTGQNAYFAMGDNSTNSLDGRAWGFVPEQAIVGRAFLVYYPFTKRWGFSD